MLVMVAAVFVAIFILHWAISSKNQETYNQPTDLQMKELRDRIELLEDGKTGHKITWKALDATRSCMATLQSSADGKDWSDVIATHECYLRIVTK